MNLEIIREKVPKLPALSIGRVALEQEVWFDQDGQAQFKVFRHLIDGVPDEVITYLTVSGRASDRSRVIQQFTQVLGEPDLRYPIRWQPDHIDLAAWSKKQL